MIAELDMLGRIYLLGNVEMALSSTETLVAEGVIGALF